MRSAYLEKEDQEKTIQYLIENKEHLKELLIDLFKERDRLLEKEVKEFHEDIEIECMQIARMIIAEDIGRNTGLSPEGILFVLECLGIDKFKEYIQ